MENRIEDKIRNLIERCKGVQDTAADDPVFQLCNERQLWNMSERPLYPQMPAVRGESFFEDIARLPEN